MKRKINTEKVQYQGTGGSVWELMFCRLAAGRPVWHGPGFLTGCWLELVRKSSDMG